MNGKKSNLLAMFDIRGNAFEKVYYQTAEQQKFCDVSTSELVNSVKLSIKDEDGELFEFRGRKLHFELEINLRKGCRRAMHTAVSYSRLSALAAAKHETISAFVTQVLDDNRFSDAEFKHITHEMKSYALMKEALRSKYAKKQAASPVLDLETIKEQIREEFRENIAATSAALN